MSAVNAAATAHASFGAPVQTGAPAAVAQVTCVYVDNREKIWHAVVHNLRVSMFELEPCLFDSVAMREALTAV